MADQAGSLDVKLERENEKFKRREARRGASLSKFD